jgi:hypothetical protein
MMATATSPPYRCGERLDPASFAKLRRSLVLEHCKWDPQVGDFGTLADFPLLMPRATWNQLAAWSEALTAEGAAAERELLSRPELLGRLGLPRRLCRALAERRRDTDNSLTPRALRYDFHLTRDGWRISECNADVPGGYAEASAFTALMAAHCPDAIAAGDPGSAWAIAIARAAEGTDVALLSAPGFMEDHQVIHYLANRLRQLGLRAHCLQPSHGRSASSRPRTHVATLAERWPRDLDVPVPRQPPRFERRTYQSSKAQPLRRPLAQRSQPPRSPSAPTWRLRRYAACAFRGLRASAPDAGTLKEKSS